jgi:signal transduction histidine kinase/DNA-binding response OmpR family regulator
LIGGNFMSRPTIEKQTGRILVVDDTTANLRLLTDLLTAEGYITYPASSGKLALEFIRTTLPDLILLDIRMPGMDGFEVCRQIKADDLTSDIPVIFISGLENERDKVEGFQVGGIDYIIKPFQRDEMLARIKTHLRLRELTVRLEQEVNMRTEELATANEGLQQMNRELRAISDCNQVLVRTDSEQTLLNRICHIVCEQAGYRMAWVGYAEHDEAKTVRPVAHAGCEEGHLSSADITWADTERGQRPPGAAIRSGKAICIQDFSADSRVAPWREKAMACGYRSSIALPLKDEALEVFGVFCIYSMQTNTFTVEEVCLLEDLAADLAFGIAALRTRIKHQEAEESLRQLNEELEERVRKRTQELAQSHEELQKAYDELKIAQSRVLQQEKMASIGQLAAGVAHEINNPMGFILSNLNTLEKYTHRLLDFQDAQEATISELIARFGVEESAIDELKKLKSSLKIRAVRGDIADLLEESVEGGERVKEIVKNLKSFARVDETEERKRADINECLDSTLNIVWNELKYNCTVVKDYGEIPSIVCNPGQLNQVFMNLLVNAAHAIESQGEIRIVTSSDEEFVKVTVEDTGCGIPADKLSRIFDPFFTTKEVGKGTGLGLSIAYDIIKNHQGEINVESEVGQGTCFSISLPVTQTDDRLSEEAAP